MGKTWSSIPTSSQSREEWERICPAGEFRVLPPSDLPAVVPSGFLGKADSVLVVSFGSPQGTTLLMVNVHRVDIRATAIDHSPLATYSRRSRQELCVLRFYRPQMVDH